MEPKTYGSSPMSGLWWSFGSSPRDGPRGAHVLPVLNRHVMGLRMFTRLCMLLCNCLQQRPREEVASQGRLVCNANPPVQRGDYYRFSSESFIAFSCSRLWEASSRPALLTVRLSRAPPCVESPIYSLVGSLGWVARASCITFNVS